MEKFSLDQKVSALVEQYKKHSLSQDWKISSSSEESSKEYRKAVQNIGCLRGRQLFYPYIGSGRGQGVYVQLKDGSIKMDLIGGIGVQILGHAHPEIMRTAVKAGLSDVLVQGHLLLNEEYCKLSKKLISLAQKNSRLQKVWLSTSGSMANENALKIIRQKLTPKRKILAFEGAFAGRTTMMSEITANPAVKQGLPSYGEVLRVPFYDPKSPDKSLDVLRSHLKKEGGDICAFIFELVQGEGGYRSAPTSFFKALMEECKKHCVAVWLDEVQTFCRTGRFFAFEKLELGSYVDLCTIGKSLQLAATFFTSEYQPQPGLVSGTFSASTPALAVSLKILEIMEQKYIEPAKGIQTVQKKTAEMFEELKAEKLIYEYDIFGLMAAFTINEESDRQEVQCFLQKLFSAGVIAFFCGIKPARVRLLLPAVITEKNLEELKAVLQCVLKKV